MKNTIRYTLMFALALTACKKDFEEINTNPNAPIEIQPEFLLRQVVYNTGEEMSYEGFVAGNLLSQHLAMVDFNLFDRHGLSEPQYGGNPWPVLYQNLRDVQILLDLSQDRDAYAVYEGPARILKAYLAATLTDIYGDVPYSEAVQGKEGNTAPAYDRQASIYTDTDGILENLDLAVSSLTGYEGTTILEGDILYGGDLQSWVRFATALKIKYLMRISGQEDVSAALSSLFFAGDYIQSNAENATFSFTDGQPNNFRMANLRSGDFNLFVMSETSDQILRKLNDPRVRVFFRPSENEDSDGFNGLQNGQDAAQVSISVADYSLTGTAFRETTSLLDANFITAWETSFLLAEAAERGWIAADAQALYEMGVAQAFEYWKTDLPDAYLTTDSAAFGQFGQDPLEQIITQKWIANTINGYESWIEYRRTGFPQLMEVAASLNNGLIPVRMPYPTDEAALNSANNSRASENTDGNSLNTPVWWDN